MTPWEIKGREFGNCNCNYSCPCQFNAMPDNGHCRGLAVYDIEEGYHGTTRLDGLGPRACSAGRAPSMRARARVCTSSMPARRPSSAQALLRILRGEDTDPFATVFNVFSSTCDTLHEPVVAEIDFEMDIDGRTARAAIAGVLEMRGAPILNPVTGAEHRVRIVQPNGFEFAEAEIGRGWSKTEGPIAYELADSYGQFAEIHLCQHGMVRP